MTSKAGHTFTAGRYTDDFGPNVARILSQASLVVRGRIPQQVRKELAAAVKAGALGHLKRDGLKPEVFFTPTIRTELSSGKFLRRNTPSIASRR